LIVETLSDAEADAALVARYANVRDEAAFTELVRRHGPMVLGVSTRMLGQHQDAEDVLQAVFLTLSARARALRRVRSVAGWLHNVAVRISLNSLKMKRRQTRGLRRLQERRSKPDRDDANELKELLDLELSRLPARYREVLILRDLEGYSRNEAARKLRLPPGTIDSRLSRGRKLLRERLVKRGVTVGVGGLAAALAECAVAGYALPTALIHATVRHAELFLLAGTRVGGSAVAAKISSLAQGELNTMFLAKLSTTVGIAGLVAMLVLGAPPVSKMVGLGSQARANTIFFDNFSDGNDAGWSHIDNTVGSAWGPGVFDASGSYTLATTGNVSATPPAISDTLFSEWSASSAPQFSNGFLRAKVRANTEGTSFFLILRRTGGSGYAFGGTTGQNDFYITRVDNTVNIPLVEVPPPSPIVAGEDWILEAGAVGNQLSLKFWRDGAAVPAAPQLTVVDSTYSSGPFLVGARKDSAFLGTGRVSATFDDIAFRVPEPSAALLMIGVACCCIPVFIRKRRATC
jgi:RNA polymerase sigma factor (sigma-70 family)